MASLKKKLVVVGDGNTGKTQMLQKLKGEYFNEYHIPGVCDKFVHRFEVDGVKVDLTLVDTMGQEDYSSLRPLSYPHTGVIVAVFSIAKPDTLENITEIWMEEIKEHMPNVPIVLVGNMSDLRDDLSTIARLARYKQVPVTIAQGVEVGKKIKAVTYVECSALNEDDVRDVFHAAARAALEWKRYPKSSLGSCCLLS